MTRPDTELDSHHAPPDRADRETIKRQAHALQKTELHRTLIDEIPTVLLILNQQRQLIFANQCLRQLLNCFDDEQLLGKRPGELFNCIHAKEQEAGCGTTKFCCKCGAVNAILACQQQQSSIEEECRITTRDGYSHEFRVQSTPLQQGTESYTLFTLQDISNEKRREALERTFFHDMNNMLQALMTLTDLAVLQATDSANSQIMETIQHLAKELTSEIASHRCLLQAEKGEYELNFNFSLQSHQLIKELVKTFSLASGEVKVIMAADSANLNLTTDQTLLRRVLFNMVKNGVEASPVGETVQIGSRQQDNGVQFYVHNVGYMPESTQLQLFQRSFSTKGKGREIGTYSMRLFGEKYLQGSVAFSSHHQQGTTFSITLPLVPDLP